MRHDVKGSTSRPRLVVGISGASGVAYGVRLLTLLKALPVETHFVMSRTAEMTLALETELKPADLRARADLLGFVPDTRNDHRAVFDPHHERDRHRCDDDPAHPCRRRGVEGTPAA